MLFPQFFLWVKIKVFFFFFFTLSQNQGFKFKQGNAKKNTIWSESSLTIDMHKFDRFS